MLQATRSAFICDIFLFIFCLWRLLFPLHLLIQIGGFPIMEPQSFATNCTYKIGNVPKLVRIPNILLLQSAGQKDVESSVTDSKYFWLAAESNSKRVRSNDVDSITKPESSMECPFWLYCISTCKWRCWDKLPQRYIL